MVNMVPSATAGAYWQVDLGSVYANISKVRGARKHVLQRPD